MGKAEASVEELVSMIERGELRLPEMQRRYVWRSTRVRDLLDSLYRGYPSGAILLWETDEYVTEKDFAVEQEKNPYTSTRLLLDGQQRLTSLAAVIRGKPVNVYKRKKPIELLFNLNHPDQLAVVTEVNETDDNDFDDDILDDETDSDDNELLDRFNKMAFVVSSKSLEQHPHWVRVTDVFKSDSDTIFLKQAGVTNFDDPNYEKFTQRLARLRGIRKYIYRMDILERSLSYSEVTEIFVRVNSLGAKLRGSDLALAQITAKWSGALGVFEEYQSKCETAGFPLELGIHLKNLVSFATGQSRFNTVSSITLPALKTAWADCCRGMDYAINFLRNNVGIDSPALLSSPFILVAIGYFGHQVGYKPTPAESRRLKYWVLMANAKGRYSRGSTETLLDQDLAILRSSRNPDDLIDRLRLQVGRLDITPDELEGRSQRSAMFKTMFLAFRTAGAQDWKSKLTIALDNSGTQHKLEYHHVFPKATLRAKHVAKDIDDIANLAFISAATNKAISANAPSTYFDKLEVETKQLIAQCIPTDRALWSVERFPDFLVERRRLIAERLNSFVEMVKEVEVVDWIPEPATEGNFEVEESAGADETIPKTSQQSLGVISPDDPTGTKPIQFELFGKPIDVQNWRDVLLKTYEELAQRHGEQEFFAASSKIAGKKRDYVARSTKGMTAPVRIPGTSLWAETNLSSKNVLSLLKLNLSALGHSEDEIELVWK